MADICELIRKLEKECNYDEALENLYIAFEEKLCHYDIQKDIGRVLNKMRRYDEALTSFELVLAMNDSHLEALFGKGISNIGLNNFDEALDLFNQVISLDKTNANAWYYKSILSKELGDDDANIYFRRFKRLDNDYFKLDRSYYKFGIRFDEIEYQFRENYPLIVTSHLKDELKSLNLDDDEYSRIIRLLPVNVLFDKIPDLKKSKIKDDEKNIICQSLMDQGFSDSDVEDMFILYDDIDDLKEEIILDSEENPFENFDNDSNFSPIELAVKYNIFKNTERLTRDRLDLFNRGNVFYDEKEFEKAIECYDECLKFNPDNKMLEFMKNCAYYNLNGDING